MSTHHEREPEPRYHPLYDDPDNPLRGYCDRCGGVLYAASESREIPGMHERCAEREMEEERQSEQQQSETLEQQQHQQPTKRMNPSLTNRGTVAKVKAMSAQQRCAAMVEAGTHNPDGTLADGYKEQPKEQHEPFLTPTDLAAAADEVEQERVARAEEWERAKLRVCFAKGQLGWVVNNLPGRGDGLNTYNDLREAAVLMLDALDRLEQLERRGT